MKIKIISTIFVFALSFLSHFMYDIFPNTLFSIVFPVNESIWEHMKLLITPPLFTAIIEIILYKKNDIKYNNFILSYIISSIVGIVIYLILYLPVHYLIGHNIFVAIIVLFISFVIIETISYTIQNKQKIKNQEIIGIILIIITYITFAYLTYNPLKNKLFYDTTKNLYGIPTKK